MHNGNGIMHFQGHTSSWIDFRAKTFVYFFDWIHIYNKPILLKFCTLVHYLWQWNIDIYWRAYSTRVRLKKTFFYVFNRNHIPNVLVLLKFRIQVQYPCQRNIHLFTWTYFNRGRFQWQKRCFTFFIEFTYLTNRFYSNVSSEFIVFDILICMFFQSHHFIRVVLQGKNNYLRF